MPTAMENFCTAYADAVTDFDALSEAEFKVAIDKANSVRNLNWKGERIPLAEAALMYAKIIGGYNGFLTDMLSDLEAEFGGSGIEVTPAREGSVCVYIWPPVDLGVQIAFWIKENWAADEIDWQSGSWVKDDVKGSLRVWWD